MTDEERKEIVFVLRKCWVNHPELKQAADQIEADGKRIAEFGEWKERQEVLYYSFRKRIAELEGALRNLLHAESRFAQAVRVATGSTYSPPILDIAEKRARAALGDKA